MDLAAEDFGKAIECDPNMADAYLNRGIVKCARATDSHNFIKTILAGKATDEAQRVLLLAQLEHIGGHDYVPQFDALLRGLRSNRDEAESLMAKSLVLFVHNDAGEAIEDLSRAIALNPDNAEAFYQRGLAYALMGETDKAIADYEQTCVLDPDHRKAGEKLEELLKSRK
jgi:tetratricopeptide (TPR) repeat protein